MARCEQLLMSTIRIIRRSRPQCRHCQTLANFPETQFLTIKPYEQNPKVLEVILNRADKLNSFTLPFWRELNEVFDTIDRDSNCRCVVLSAAGRAFCAGIDLKDGLGAMASVVYDEGLDVARRSRKVGDMIETCQRSFSSLERCRKPVIAAIHGYCIGAGISLVGCADIRYAACDTVFSIKEVDIGIAADVGILNRINRLVANDSLTRELTFTARDLGATEALQYGFISRQFASREDCLKAALSLASEIADRSPVAVQGSKMILNYSRDHPTDQSLQLTRIWNQSQLQCNDITDIVSSKQDMTQFRDV